VKPNAGLYITKEYEVRYIRLRNFKLLLGSADNRPTKFRHLSTTRFEHFLEENKWYD
jgi:hypothetical protein